MELVPVTTSFGVEVRGVDLAVADLDEIRPALREAYERSRLLVLRRQRLSVAARHPRTGEEVLMVNELHTDRIADMPGQVPRAAR